MDTPDKRKIHAVGTPSMGGIPIFLAVTFSLLIWLPYEVPDRFKYLIGALVLVFIIGLRDDLIPLKPQYKLINQLIPSIMVIYLSGIILDSLYGLFYIEDIPIVVSWSLTLIAIIVITNSFNLIDGIDGLAGFIGLVMLTSFGIWFHMIEMNIISYLIFSFVGAIFSFLIFNWQPSKIFMGDTGALLIGFLLACVAITFINANYNLNVDHPYKFKATISTAICVMIIPLWDTMRVFILRVIRSRSPFTADKNHIHHLLLRLGLSHTKINLLLATVNLLFISIAVLGRKLSDHVLLPVIIGIAIALSIILKKIVEERKKSLLHSTSESTA